MTYKDFTYPYLYSDYTELYLNSLPNRFHERLIDDFNKLKYSSIICKVHFLVIIHYSNLQELKHYDTAVTKTERFFFDNISMKVIKFRLIFRQAAFESIRISVEHM